MKKYIVLIGLICVLIEPSYSDSLWAVQHEIEDVSQIKKIREEVTLLAPKVKKASNFFRN